MIVSDVCDLKVMASDHQHVIVSDHDLCVNQVDHDLCVNQIDHSVT